MITDRWQYSSQIDVIHDDMGGWYAYDHALGAVSALYSDDADLAEDLDAGCVVWSSPSSG